MNTKQYIILAVTGGITRHNTPYMRLKVADLETKFEISVWDISKDEMPTVGQRVEFSAINENKQYKDATKKDTRFFDYDINHELSKLLSIVVTKDQWNELKQDLLKLCNHDTLDMVINEQMDRLYELYAEFPAASIIHHAYKGGLLNHTYETLNMLRGIYPTLSFPVKIEHVILGLLFHDFGKTHEYTDTGVTEDISLLGHIYLGAQELHNILEEWGMAGNHPAETKRIVHTVLSHHNKLEHGSPVVPCTPEAFLVFHLDALSGHGDIFANATNGEYNKFVGTTVYRNEK
jgi:3'-5' exoribonuclease